ncbi:Endodeoxyribonuclease RusA [compost metagenome]
MERIDVRVTWYCDTMRQDKDNISAGVKFILDGLQAAGVIKNDGWKQIGRIEHDFAIDRENPRVEVDVIEVSA